MKKPTLALLTCVALTFPVSSLAEEVEHYEGEKSATLKEAVANFSEYNEKLEEILDGELTPEAMNEIHQITYTLENALGKINEEIDGLAVTLEEIHLASESADTNAVASNGKDYLETSRTVIE